MELWSQGCRIGTVSTLRSPRAVGLWGIYSGGVPGKAVDGEDTGGLVWSSHCAKAETDSEEVSSGLQDSQSVGFYCDGVYCGGDRYFLHSPLPPSRLCLLTAYSAMIDGWVHPRMK